MLALSRGMIISYSTMIAKVTQRWQPLFSRILSKNYKTVPFAINYTNFKFTIVCHSMGALVTRWYMEMEGGDKNVVQWIGIGPTNHGAALASKIDDATLSALDKVLGRPAVLQLRTNSDTVRLLESSYPASGITYRVLVGDNKNPKESPNFISSMGLPAKIGTIFVDGKTWASMPGFAPCPIWVWPSKGCWLTYFGDGVVADVESWLPGADFHSCTGANHVNVEHTKVVLDYVLTCIEIPKTVVTDVGIDYFLNPSDPNAPPLDYFYNG